MIYTETLSTGKTKYIVRTQRYGKRKVLGRFNTPEAAIDCEVDEFCDYLDRVWIRGHKKSTNEN